MLQLEEQIANVIKEYPEIHLIDNRHLKGRLPFRAKYIDYPLIVDAFEIEMEISQDYPNVLPIVKEHGHRMDDYPHINTNLSFCLGAPLAIRKKFSENPTLLGYLREQVIPFLYSFCVWQDCGVFPFGDLSHGAEGIIEFYREYLNINNDLSILELLHLCVINSSRPRQLCPCGEGKRFNKCHGPRLQEIYNYSTRNERLYDFQQALAGYKIRHKKIPTKFQFRNRGK